MDRTKIPTKYDLAENDFCLDTLSMLKTFLGKTYDEAYALCRDSSVAEDFSYMKVVGLKFYLQVAFDYLRSDEVIDEDWGFPSGLLCSLHCHVVIWGTDKSIYPLIKDIAIYCKENTKKLDLDEECNLYKKYIDSIECA